MDLLPPLHTNCLCRIVPTASMQFDFNDDDSIKSTNSQWYKPYLNNLKDIPADIMDLLFAFIQSQQKRWERQDVIGFFDWLTSGLVSSFIMENRNRSESVIKTPNIYNIGNLLTYGLFDLGKDSIFPDKPLSLGHILDSLGFAGALLGIYEVVQKSIHVRKSSREGEKPRDSPNEESDTPPPSNRQNIDEFIAGKKTFEDVLDDYAKIYSENINSNQVWSWDDPIPGGNILSKKQRMAIKQKAVNSALIPNVVVTKVPGLKYGFADFESAGVVKETMNLPESMWKLSDSVQFKWLDQQINGTIIGYTWHHTEIPGKMQLVPYGVHNITAHNGGRSIGMWVDSPR